MSDTGSNWGDSSYQRTVSQTTWRRRWQWIVGIGGTLLLIAGVTAWYFLVYLAPYPLSVDVSIASPALAPGSTSEIVITAVNVSPETAFDAEIAITLPDKTRIAALPNETVSSTTARPVVRLGDIAAGGTASVRLLVDTELDPSSAVPLIADLTYTTTRDRTRWFNASARVDLVIEQPALGMTIESPSKVVRGETFTATLRYRNNLLTAMTDTVIQLTLPRGVTLVKSDPLLFDNRVPLTNLAPGQTGVVTLTLRPTNDAPASFGIRAIASRGNESIAEQVAPVVISGESLAVRITTNDRSTFTFKPDDIVTFDIAIQNIASVPLKDIAVQARLGSSLFDVTSVVTRDGSLAPGEPVITWNTVGVPGLRTLAPGETVPLSFTVRFVRTTTGANLTAPITVTATSPTVPPGVTGPGVTGTAVATGQRAGDVIFTADGFWRDPLAQLVNGGSLPPRVGVPMRYGIRWSVAPTAADSANTVVTTSLPPGIRFTGVIAGTPSSTLSHDPRTGQVTWRPGVVTAGTTARAAFQIEVTPAPNQVGSSLLLAEESRYTGTDAFTGESLEKSLPQITSQLSEIPGGQAGAQVAP